MRVSGLGFRVEGSGFRVQGSGFRLSVHGLQCRACLLVMLLLLLRRRLEGNRRLEALRRLVCRRVLLLLLLLLMRRRLEARWQHHPQRPLSKWRPLVPWVPGRRPLRWMRYGEPGRRILPRMTPLIAARSTRPLGRPPRGVPGTTWWRALPLRALP